MQKTNKNDDKFKLTKKFKSIEENNINDNFKNKLFKVNNYISRGWYIIYFIFKNIF